MPISAPESSSRSGSLRAKNLNLLPLVLEILQTQSVTRASERLHLSQSTTSEGLAKARALFGDELLIRVGRSMEKTPFAEWLEPRLAASLEDLRELFTEQTVDVESMRRHFVVATADYIVMLFAAPLIARLQEQAPGVSVQFVELSGSTPRTLERAEVDLMVLPDGVIDLGSFPSNSLFEERYVVIARKGHPSLPPTRRGRSGRPKLTRRQFERCLYAAYRPSRDSPGSAASDALRRAEIEPREVLSTAQFTLLPHLVEESDAIALVQERLALKFQRLAAIEILEPFFEVPRLDIRAYWSPLLDADLEHAWFRSQVEEIAAAV